MKYTTISCSFLWIMHWCETCTHWQSTCVILWRISYANLPNPLTLELWDLMACYKPKKMPHSNVAWSVTKNISFINENIYILGIWTSKETLSVFEHNTRTCSAAPNDMLIMNTIVAISRFANTLWDWNIFKVRFNFSTID